MQTDKEKDILGNMNAQKYRQIIKSQSEILLFGKFKHKTIQYVLRTEPSYIIWLASENIVRFPDEIIELAEDRQMDDLDNEISSHGHNYSSYYDDDSIPF